jgi:hypothetical protein
MSGTLASQNLKQAKNQSKKLTKHMSLHTVIAQNRNGPPIHPSHIEHTTLDLNSSTRRTLCPSLLFNSRNNPFTGPGA